MGSFVKHITALRDTDIYARRKAAKALGKLKDARAIVPLTAALQDADRIVRYEAVYALGEIGAVKALRVALTNSHAGVRFWAAKLLGKITQ